MPSTPEPLRLLVALEALRPGGVNGGVKQGLHQQFLWLREHSEQPFRFVYLCQADMEDELRQGWLRPGDQVVALDEAAPDLAVTAHCDMVYSAFGLTRWAHPAVPLLCRIDDLLHRDYPETLSADARQDREQHFAQAVVKAGLIQVTSDYTAARLRHHYGVAPERIVRTYQPNHRRLADDGPPPQTAAAASQAPTSPYFFYPANAWAHKNHKTLFVAYAQYRHLAQQAGVLPWRLRLTGASDAAMQALRGIAQRLCLEPHLDFLGYVDEPTLAQTWAQAGALVFPSLHEGFGVPPLEAMQHGVPVLAHNGTAIPEVTGEAALLVDAHAPTKLAHGMLHIASDATLRTKLISLGHERVAKFTPEAAFGPLIPAFRSLLSSPPPKAS